MSVLSQEREHRPGRKQVSRDRLDIVNLTLTIIMSLHEPSLNHAHKSMQRHALTSIHRSAEVVGLVLIRADSGYAGVTGRRTSLPVGSTRCPGGVSVSIC